MATGTLKVSVRAGSQASKFLCAEKMHYSSKSHLNFFEVTVEPALLHVAPDPGSAGLNAANQNRP